MAIIGYLLPFPDPGAADLMSDHLEQVVDIYGPGQILMTMTLPRAISRPAEETSAEGSPLRRYPSRFARKMLELFEREGDNWKRIWGATTDSEAASEKVERDVCSPGTLKCRLTNMGGMEGQFSLECTYIPY